MSSKSDKWAIAISLLALLLTLGFNLFMWTSYYQPALRLLQQQAEKKPVLLITVDPSSSFNVTGGFYGYTVSNTTYVLRSQEKMSFHIFLSNIGTSPTVAEFLLIAANLGESAAGGEGYPLNATILRPGDSHEWMIPFHVPDAKAKSNLSIQFAFVTTDGVITKTILYEVIPSP